jgi:hypothetical protein
MSDGATKNTISLLNADNDRAVAEPNPTPHARRTAKRRLLRVTVQPADQLRPGDASP